MEKSEESSRRRFLRRISGLGVAAGASTLLLSRDRSLMPLAQASSGSGTNLQIDTWNNGVDSTTIESNVWSCAFRGKNTNPDGGSGVDGWATSQTGATIGVFGLSESTQGKGVAGYASAGSGTTYGVYGSSNSTGGYGVYGATSGGFAGVYGKAGTPWGSGVYGYASNISGSNCGVYGQSDSIGGKGVSGYAHSTSTSGSNYGAFGQSDSTDGIGVYGWATAGSGYTYGVYGEVDSPQGISVLGYAKAGIPMVAIGASGQTSSLQEWRRDFTSKLAVVDKDGQFGIGTSAPARQLHIRGNNAVARLDRDVDSASFIFTRTAAGNFNTVWKTFTFGVKATGVDSGSFFIGDMHTNVSGSSDNRLLIDTNGNVGIGTTAPSSKLHVAGRVKALGYDTGDITYANGMKTTEEGTGLAFLNDAGEKIAVLDREGNLRIKGRLIQEA